MLNGDIDLDFITNHAEGFEQYSTLVFKKSLAQSAKICGVSEQKIRLAAKYIAEATTAHPAPRHAGKKPEKWIAEGFRLAVSEVYTFGLETGTREHPITLPPGYEANAAKVAQQRIAIAGYRLAAVLNEKLK